MDRIAQLKAFLEDSPGDSFLQHALALEYIKLNDDAAARGVFEALLAREPGYVGSYYHLGRLLERTGERDAAIATLRGISAADAAMKDVVETRLARLLVDAGKPADALALLGQRLEPLPRRIDPTDARVVDVLFVDEQHELVGGAALGSLHAAAVEPIHLRLRHRALGHAGVELVDLGAVIYLRHQDHSVRRIANFLDRKLAFGCGLRLLRQAVLEPERDFTRQ